jgi:hypothetical protein
MPRELGTFMVLKKGLLGAYKVLHLLLCSAVFAQTVLHIASMTTH